MKGAPYDSVCIKNKTDLSINFTYKWGDGDRKEKTIKPNWQMLYYWDKSNYRLPSPDFIIRFDYDFSEKDEFKEYILEKKKNKDGERLCKSSKIYLFKSQESEDNKIDLYKTN